MKTSLTSRPATSEQKHQVVRLTEVALKDGFTRSDLQVVHSNGKKYQENFKKFLLQFIGKLSSELVVEVDCSLFLEDAVKAGSYDSQYISTGAKLPPSGLNGVQRIKVGFNKRDRVTTNQEWFDYLKGLGESFIHPLVLLAIGAKFPDKQRQAPLFTLWFDENGLLWYLCLNEFDGQRYLHMNRYSLGYYWGAYCLAVSARK